MGYPARVLPWIAVSAIDSVTYVFRAYRTIQGLVCAMRIPRRFAMSLKLLRGAFAVSLLGLQPRGCHGNITASESGPAIRRKLKKGVCSR